MDKSITYVVDEHEILCFSDSGVVTSRPRVAPKAEKKPSVTALFWQAMAQVPKEVHPAIIGVKVEQ